MRSESEIFDDLAALCRSRGYIHAVAAICARENIFVFEGRARTEDMVTMFSNSSLIRTEIMTLIGLMMRCRIDFTTPPQETVTYYVQRSYELLKELHNIMKEVIFQEIFPRGENVEDRENTMLPESNPFATGKFLREPIYYGGESAYSFQYRDLAPKKYAADTSWLLRNRNVDMKCIQDMSYCISRLVNEKIMKIRSGQAGYIEEEKGILSAFTVSYDEIMNCVRCASASMWNIVEAFTLPEDSRNAEFNSLHDFNAAYAYPFIRKSSDEFVVLQQHYGLAEAAYETPFYWMCADKEYKAIADRNRGEFTESFAAERLRCVFGSSRVYRNVEFIGSKHKILGEIDVLVVFGNCAIILQAKSKKLTISSRKGHDGQLKKDFKAAIQDAIDQAFKCVELLESSTVNLRCANGDRVSLPYQLRTIFPVAVISEHYPALAFQTQQFLKFQKTDKVIAPLVLDIFALDAITEMLGSPIRLLSYFNLRAHFSDKLVGNHELTLLSYHLKGNLWIEDDIGLACIGDDMSSDLDIAMAARRDDLLGSTIPEGILTRLNGTSFARIMEAIENDPRPFAVDIGLFLSTLEEKAALTISRHVDRILGCVAADGELHDVTLYYREPATGLTIHSSWAGRSKAEIRLKRHCTMRKYTYKADVWYGLALNPDGSIYFGIEERYPWKFEAGMESMTPRQSNIGRKKIGRNDLCPCGSGKKYKKCCIDRKIQ